MRTLMTVGALRGILVGYPDDAPVLLAGPAGHTGDVFPLATYDDARTVNGRVYLSERDVEKNANVLDAFAAWDNADVAVILYRDTETVDEREVGP